MVLVFVAMAALAIASMVEAKTWEEDDMIIVEGRSARSFNSLLHVGESPILARS